ncbi:MAG: hypothetical protein GY861_16890, partial [bacterium]|nr:hypothetical protein [bacterium]
MLVCLAMYYRSLNYQPVVDDIANRKKYNNPDFKPNKLSITSIRRNLTGEDPIRNVQIDRVLTIFIHTITCMLMYKAFNSLPASLLFAVNVSNNQVSLWLNGKRYGISAILCLLSYILAPVGIVFWFFTPFFQASAFTFPIVLAFKGYPLLLMLSPLAFILGNQYLAKWIKLRADRINTVELKTWNWKKPILMCKTITYYFIRGLVPYIPLMYHRYLMHFGCTDKDSKEAYKPDLLFIIGLLLVLLIPTLYFINPIIGFGLLWWLITITVYSNWITLTVPIAER